MNVPFFDIGRLNHTIDSKIHTAIMRVLESGWYILGNECSKLEQVMTLQLKGKSLVGCNSGTDALILSLLAAGVSHGDEVITVANTAIPTVAAICATGATPVFVDIDPTTWLLDSALVAAALTVRTKAVIAVHLFGNMADINKLVKELHAAGREDVAIIEDVAQAQGATLNGLSSGILGRFGAFSFYPSKNIGALGDGGAVHCSSDSDSVLVRELRNYGQKDRYHAETKRGINSRLDEVQAAIITEKLPLLDTWNRRKAELMETYRRELANLPLTFQGITPGCTPAWHLCVIALENSQQREQLQQHLGQAGIQTLIHYPIPCHLQAAFTAARHDGLPITEKMAQRIMSLPLSPVLTDDEQRHVINVICTFYNR